MTATEYRLALERAEREKVRKARREEILAAKKANAVAAEEKKEALLDGLKEYEIQSKKTQQIHFKERRSQSEQRAVSTQYKLSTFRSVRKSKLKYDLEVGQLENKKANAELSGEIREALAKSNKELQRETTLAKTSGLRALKHERVQGAKSQKQLLEKNRQEAQTSEVAKVSKELEEKALLLEQRRARIEGLKTLKRGKAETEETEKKILEKNRESAERDAKVKELQAREDKSLLGMQRQAKIDAVKNIKRGQAEAEEAAKELLVKEREMAQATAKANASKTLEEKALLRDQRQAKIEAVKNIKRGQAETEESEKAILVKERENAQATAKVIALKSADEKALLRDQRQAEIEAVRNIKRGQAAAEEAEKAILVKERENAQATSKANALKSADEKALLRNQRQAQIEAVRNIKRGQAETEQTKKAILAMEREDAQATIKASALKSAEEKALLRDQRQAEIEAVRNIKRGQAETEEAERAILAKERENAQANSKASASRSADEKALLRNQRQAEIEAVRNIKRGQAETEETEKAILVKERENAQAASKANALKSAEEKVLLRDQRQAEIEAVRNIKRGQAETEKTEKAILVKERENAQATSKSNALKSAEEKALLRDQRQAEIEAVRNIKRGQAGTEEAERAILVKERENAIASAKADATKSAREKALLQQQRQAEIEGIRNIKRGQSAEREKQHAVLANGRAMALSASQKRQEAAARDRALKHAHSLGEIEGRRSASQQREAAQTVKTVGVVNSHRGEWGGKSHRSASLPMYSKSGDNPIGSRI